MVYKNRQNLYLLFNNVNEMDIFLLLLTAVLGLVIIQRILNEVMPVRNIHCIGVANPDDH